MVDREKVIRDVRYYIDYPGLAPMHYYGAEMVTMPKPLLEDAIALLKAQEPTWRRGAPFCSKCGRQFGCGYKYCPDCGQAVKWG